MNTDIPPIYNLFEYKGTGFNGHEQKQQQAFFCVSRLIMNPVISQKSYRNWPDHPFVLKLMQQHLQMQTSQIHILLIFRLRGDILL